MILDYKADESYTPSKISIRAGTTVHDLRVRGFDMQASSHFIAMRSCQRISTSGLFA